MVQTYTNNVSFTIIFRGLLSLSINRISTNFPKKNTNAIIPEIIYILSMYILHGQCFITILRIFNLKLQYHQLTNQE
jgi:hypothetical protein